MPENQFGVPPEYQAGGFKKIMDGTASIQENLQPHPQENKKEYVCDDCKAAGGDALKPRTHQPGDPVVVFLKNGKVYMACHSTTINPVAAAEAETNGDVVKEVSYQEFKTLEWYDPLQDMADKYVNYTMQEKNSVGAYEAEVRKEAFIAGFKAAENLYHGDI